MGRDWHKGSWWSPELSTGALGATSGLGHHGSATCDRPHLRPLCPLASSTAGCCHPTRGTAPPQGRTGRFPSPKVPQDTSQVLVPPSPGSGQGQSLSGDPRNVRESSAAPQGVRGTLQHPPLSSCPGSIRGEERGPQESRRRWLQRQDVSRHGAGRASRGRQRDEGSVLGCLHPAQQERRSAGSRAWPWC